MSAYSRFFTKLDIDYCTKLWIIAIGKIYFILHAEFVNAKAPVGRLRVFYQDVASLQVNRKSFSKEPCLLQRKSGQDNKKSIVTFQLSYIILDMADIMFSFIMFVGPYLSSKCNSTWSNEQLTIPNVTPSIVNCNILKVVYFVKVRAVIREHSVDSQAIFLTLQASHL